MTVLGRDEAGRLIPVFEKASKEMAEKMDRRNSILTLLCLNDALDSVGQKVLRPLVRPEMRHPETTLQEQFAVHERLMEQLMLSYEALDMVLTFSHQRDRAFRNLPRIRVGIGESSSDALIEMMRGNGAVKPDDLIFAAEPELTPSVRVGFAIVVDFREDPLVEASASQVLRLTLALRRTHAARTAVTLNLPLTFVDGQPVPMVNFPTGLSLEGMAELRKRTARDILDSDRSVSGWAADMRQASVDGMLTLESGIGSQENWNALLRELREGTKAFCIFKGFEESFASSHGYTVTQLSSAVESLMLMSRGTTEHTLYLGGRVAFRKQLKSLTKLSNSVIDRIIGSFTWRPGLHYIQAPIVMIGSHCYFSMTGVMGGILVQLEDHFSNPRFSDELGRKFEGKCREILSSRGFIVYPKALELPVKYLPDEVSTVLWNRIKIGSDIDVIARKRDFLFLFECKERKISKGKEIRLGNLLSKTQMDLRYRALWVRNNLETFKRMVGQDWSEKLVDSEFGIVPVLVSNQSVENLADPDIPLVTIFELQRLGKVETKEAEGKKYAILFDTVTGRSQRAVVL